MTRKYNFLIVILALFHLSNAALPEQCTGVAGKCPEHSTCDDANTDNCVCNKGYTLNDDEDGCVAKGLNDECSDNSDCSAVADSICGTESPRKCICKNSHQPHETEGTCEPKGLDDECSDEADCANVANAICGTGSPRKCVCKDTHKPHENDGTCVTKGLNDECTANTDCSAVTDAICGTESPKKCICKDTHKPHETDGTCEPKTVDELTCTDTVNQCEGITNAECDEENEKCRCSLGFTMNANTCVGNTAPHTTIGFASMFCCFLALLITLV